MKHAILWALVALQAAQADPPPEVRRALATLEKSPDDGPACSVAGRYYLSTGDTEKALPYLKKCSDDALRAAALAEEGASEAKGAKLVEIGDLWVKALAKNRAARQAILDRASEWYAKAWPDLDELWKAKLRERLAKLYVPQVPVRGMTRPPGWGGPVDPVHRTILSAERVHSGGRAAKCMPGKRAKSPRLLITPTVPLRGGSHVEYSIWVLSEGTESLDDYVLFFVADAEGTNLTIGKKFMQADLPVWKRLTWEVNVPDNAARGAIEVVLSSQGGVVFVDDLSIKVDGKEVLQGGGFEER